MSRPFFVNHFAFKQIFSTNIVDIADKHPFRVLFLVPLERGINFVFEKYDADRYCARNILILLNSGDDCEIINDNFNIAQEECYRVECRSWFRILFCM